MPKSDKILSAKQQICLQISVDVIARFETDGDAVEVDNLIKLQKRYSDECYVSEYLFL